MVGSPLRGHGEKTGKSAHSLWSAPSSGGRYAGAGGPITALLGSGWQWTVGLRVGVTQVDGQATQNCRAAGPCPAVCLAPVRPARLAPQQALPWHCPSRAGAGGGLAQSSYCPFSATCPRALGLLQLFGLVSLPMHLGIACIYLCQS